MKTHIPLNPRTFPGRSAPRITSLAGCALLAFSAMSAQADPAEGLIAYYPFDGTLQDVSETVPPAHGVGKVGEDDAPVTFAAGKFGDAIDLDDGTYVSTDPELSARWNFGVPDDPSGFSISAWFRVDDFTKSWQCLIAKGEGQRWRVHRRDAGDIMTGNGGADDVPAGVTDVNDGALHHLVLISDPVNDRQALYVDNVLQGETSGLRNEANDMPMMIGENPDARNRTWQGLIDDVGVWNRPLSVDEIGQIWNGGDGASIESFLDPSDPNVSASNSARVGPVPIVDTDTAFELPIRNTGDTKALAVSGFVLSGPDADHFTIVESPSSIAPEGRGVLKMTFNGKRQLGEFKAQVDFTTNDPDADDKAFTVEIVAVVLNPDGPLAHFRLDETDASGEAADSTGNGNVGGFDANGGSVTLGGGPLAAGLGTSLSVKGGGAFVYENGGSGFPLNDFTVSLWFTPNALGDAAAGDLLTIVGQGSSSPEFALLLADGELHWFGDPDAPDVVFSTDGVGIVIGRTYHVAMVYDSATDTGTIVLDGVAVASGNVPQPGSDGAFYAGAFGPGALGFDGALDDIQFYDRVLTVDEEIAWLKANPGQVLNPFRDPNVKIDSDKDGLEDAEEVALGTNPLLADTDGDGLGDGAERNVHQTDPLKMDTDGDGGSDGSELFFGANPLDPADRLGTFLVRTVKAAAGLQFGGMDAFKDALIDQASIENEHVGNFTFVNFRDNAQGHFAQDELPFPLWTTFGDREDFGIYVTGTIKIAEAGVRTFGVNSDDGFELRIDGELVAEFPAPRGSADTFGSADLTAGDHKVELWFYERGGGAHVEMFVNTQVGSVENFADGNFVLLPAFGDAKADADGDGLNDFFEQGFFGNNNATPDGDPDADGLNNLAEQTAGTDPTKADTDGDGLNDKVEVETHSTNPTLADTDSDGLNDSQEVTLGTDPFNKDTDDDGLLDGREVADGSDPNDPNSPPAPDEFKNGLIAYFPFDGDLEDKIGENHGEGMGAGPIVFDTGAFGQGIDLNGVDQFVQVPNEELFDFGAPENPTGFTISAWFRVDAYNKSWQALIAKGEGNRWRVHRRDATNTITGNGGNGDVPAGPTNVNDGGIHHLALVSDADGDAAALYIDGVLEAQNSALAREGNDNPMMIGENPDARGRTWNGLIDDVAIWARPLSGAEVKAIATSTRSLGDLLKGTDIIQILGVGVGSLLGSDLTDPENNGLDALGAATDPSWNWVAISSSHEPDFEGGENSFNIFDNKVGGGNDKWCCDDPTPDNPVWVSVEFAKPVSLTHFTITNGNDTPERDPTNWAIQGSNDGVNFVNIFAETAQSIWSATRNEVALVTLGVPSAPYKHLRYIAFDTPATLHQLNEIEYFGNVSGGTRPGTISDVVKASDGAGGAISFDFPAGTTFDVEYSVDLVTWTVIANGVTGTYQDANAGRTGSPEGYYRGVAP